MTTDPKTVAMLLRAIAGGTEAKASKHDIILNTAADLLDTGDPIPLHQNEARLLADRLRWIHQQENISLDLAAEICNSLAEIIFLDELVAVRRHGDATALPSALKVELLNIISREFSHPEDDAAVRRVYEAILQQFNGMAQS